MLSFFRRLFGRSRLREERIDLGGAPAGLWVPAAENPFGVDIFDCADYCQSMPAPAGPHDIETFRRLRSSSGEEYRGRLPADPVTIPCDLTYPYDGRHQDGPLSKAGSLEEKWDFYLFDDRLSLVHSWTDELVYVGDLTFGERDVRLKSVAATRSRADDPALAVAVVDFLIKSHLHGMMVPHPFPKGLARDPRTLTLYSFEQYGRRAFCGTFADTTQFRVPRHAAYEPSADL
jgi:hypothetical protein